MVCALERVVGIVVIIRVGVFIVDCRARVTSEFHLIWLEREFIPKESKDFLKMC
jgi:L-asparagine transporter-like permease